jgi:hypothetical protein
MTSYEFVIWLKGFTEACNDYTATPKQWDRIKEVLDEVEDYDDNHGIDVEIDDYNPNWRPNYNPNLTVPSTGTVHGSGSSPSIFTMLHGTGTTANTVSNTVWNDKMGCWHYTNYPEGFGYYTNTTLGKTTPEETKKQLLD